MGNELKTFSTKSEQEAINKMLLRLEDEGTYEVKRSLENNMYYVNQGGKKKYLLVKREVLYTDEETFTCYLGNRKK